jgi:hypothetical protein
MKHDKIESESDYYYALRSYLDNEKIPKLEDNIMRYEFNTGHNIFGFTDEVIDKKLKELGY